MRALFLTLCLLVTGLSIAPNAWALAAIAQKPVVVLVVVVLAV